MMFYLLTKNPILSASYCIRFVMSRALSLLVLGIGTFLLETMSMMVSYHKCC